LQVFQTHISSILSVFCILQVLHLNVSNVAHRIRTGSWRGCERSPRAHSAGDVRGRGPPRGRETQAWARAWTRENGRLVSGRGRALAVPKYKRRDSTAATRKR
jgi:hypothetical protein